METESRSGEVLDVTVAYQEQIPNLDFFPFSGDQPRGKGHSEDIIWHDMTRWASSFTDFIFVDLPPHWNLLVVSNQHPGAFTNIHRCVQVRTLLSPPKDKIPAGAQHGTPLFSSPSRTEGTGGGDRRRPCRAAWEVLTLTSPDVVGIPPSAHVCPWSDRRQPLSTFEPRALFRK